MRLVALSRIQVFSSESVSMSCTLGPDLPSKWVMSRAPLATSSLLGRFLPVYYSNLYVPTVLLREITYIFVTNA